MDTRERAELRRFLDAADLSASPEPGFFWLRPERVTLTTANGGEVLSYAWPPDLDAYRTGEWDSERAAAYQAASVVGPRDKVLAQFLALAVRPKATARFVREHGPLCVRSDGVPIAYACPAHELEFWYEHYAQLAAGLLRTAQRAHEGVPCEAVDVRTIREFTQPWAERASHRDFLSPRNDISDDELADPERRCQVWPRKWNRSELSMASFFLGQLTNEDAWDEAQPIGSAEWGRVAVERVLGWWAIIGHVRPEFLWPSDAPPVRRTTGALWGAIGTQLTREIMAMHGSRICAAPECGRIVPQASRRKVSQNRRVWCAIHTAKTSAAERQRESRARLKLAREAAHAAE